MEKSPQFSHTHTQRYLFAGILSLSGVFYEYDINWYEKSGLDNLYCIGIYKSYSKCYFVIGLILMFEVNIFQIKTF